MDDSCEYIKSKDVIYVNSHFLLTKTFFMKRLFTIMLFAAMLFPWAVNSQTTPGGTITGMPVNEDELIRDSLLRER